MKKYKISIDYLRDIMPKSNINERYLGLYMIYRELFNEYIIQKLELEKYDYEILKSEYKLKQVAEDNMDLYQYWTNNKLKYLYIRNNIYIEKLDKKELKWLENRIIANRDNLDDDAKKFIERTYVKVIFEDTGRDGKKYNAFYGPTTTKYMARNDSIVIGIRYDDYYSYNMSDQEWGELRKKQLDFLKTKIRTIIEEQKSKVENPIAIIQYNDYSIEKKLIFSKN